ncbi:hypothetical protein JOB18_040010, partial [Solea senegalensis]
EAQAGAYQILPPPGSQCVHRDGRKEKDTEQKYIRVHYRLYRWACMKIRHRRITEKTTRH